MRGHGREVVATSTVNQAPPDNRDIGAGLFEDRGGFTREGVGSCCARTVGGQSGCDHGLEVRKPLARCHGGWDRRRIHDEERPEAWGRHGVLAGDLLARGELGEGVPGTLVLVDEPTGGTSTRYPCRADSKTASGDGDGDVEVDGDGNDDVEGTGVVRIPGEEATGSAVGVAVALPPEHAAMAKASDVSLSPRNREVMSGILPREMCGTCLDWNRCARHRTVSVPCIGSH